MPWPSTACCFVSISVTAPCGPSRASLHTGLYLMNHRSGRNGTPLDERHTNLAHEVRKLGLDPMLFGYTDTSADPRGRHPDDPALRTFEGPLPGYRVGLLFPDYMAAWMHDLRAKGYQFEGRKDVYQPQPGFDKPADRGHRFIPTRFKARDSDTNFMAEQVIAWLDDHRRDDWFMHCVFLRPHPPVIAPEPYNALYDPASVPLQTGATRRSRKPSSTRIWPSGSSVLTGPVTTTSTTRTTWCTCPSWNCGRCGPATA